MDEQEFREHGVWSSVRLASTSLDDFSDLAPDAAADERRIRQLAAYVLSFSSDAPEFYSAYLLDPVAATWQIVVNNIANARANPGGGYLNVARSTAEQSLVAVGAWPSKSSAVVSAKRASALLRETQTLVTDYTESIQRQKTSTDQAHLTELNSYAEAIEARDKELVDLRAEVEDFRSIIARDRTRLDTAITTQQEAFLSAQAERQDDIQRQNKEAAAAAKKELAEADRRIQVFETEARSSLEHLQTLQEQVEKTSGGVVSSILARDYSRYSFREFVSGLIFYVLGFGLLGASSVPLVLAVIAASEGITYSWQSITLKLGLTAAAGGLAAVAIRIGSRFILSSTTNKRVDLELRALTPLLADIADPKVAENAKIAFIERMFGRAWEDKPANYDETASLENLGKLAAIVASLQSGKLP